MTAGGTELVIIAVIALLLFAPAIAVGWGGYMIGRKQGREEGAAQARADSAAEGDPPAPDDAETGIEVERETGSALVEGAEEDADE